MLRAAAAAVPAASFALKMAIMAAEIFHQLEDENSGPFADEYTIDAHRHRRGLRVYRPPGSSVGTQRGILPEDLKGGAQARPSSPGANVPVREPQSYEDCLRRLRVGEVGGPAYVPPPTPEGEHGDRGALQGKVTDLFFEYERKRLPKEETPTAARKKGPLRQRGPKPEAQALCEDTVGIMAGFSRAALRGGLDCAVPLPHGAIATLMHLLQLVSNDVCVRWATIPVGD